MKLFDALGRRALAVSGFFHERLVSSRRMPVIAAHLARAIPYGARVLDVGAGDGMVDSLVLAARSDVTIHGIDVGKREYTYIPVSAFDGVSIPFGSKSFDVVMLIDVLHHTEDPQTLLQEAARVADVIILKDHTKCGLLAGLRLRFMDYVGNRYTNSNAACIS